jgi:hypothetical protein
VSMAPSSDICYLSGPGTVGNTILERKVTTRRWFSGAFTNYVPPSAEFGGLSAATKLLGLDLTPEVIWEVTPWSWAVDWFTNAGSIISNYTAFEIDGLVMRYGYIMEHVVSVNSYYHEGPTGTIFGDAARPPVMEFVTETKSRRRATPYGFGLDMGALSGFQQSIIAALGLSRAGR